MAAQSRIYHFKDFSIKAGDTIIIYQNSNMWGGVVDHFFGEGTEVHVVLNTTGNLAVAQHKVLIRTLVRNDNNAIKGNRNWQKHLYMSDLNKVGLTPSELEWTRISKPGIKKSDPFEDPNRHFTDVGTKLNVVTDPEHAKQDFLDWADAQQGLNPQYWDEENERLVKIGQQFQMRDKTVTAGSIRNNTNQEQENMSQDQNQNLYTVSNHGKTIIENHTIVMGLNISKCSVPELVSLITRVKNEKIALEAVATDIKSAALTKFITDCDKALEEIIYVLDNKVVGAQTQTQSAPSDIAAAVTE